MIKSIIALALAAVAAAAPSSLEERQWYEPCSGLYNNALCCSTDILEGYDTECTLRMYNLPGFSRTLSSNLLPLNNEGGD